MNLHASSYGDIYITSCVQLFPALEYEGEGSVVENHIHSQEGVEIFCFISNAGNSDPNTSEGKTSDLLLLLLF